MAVDVAMLDFLNSSSSSDEDEEVISALLSTGRNFRMSIQNYEELIVSRYTEYEFKTFFRVKTSVFRMLSNRFASSEFAPDSPLQGEGREVISRNKHLLIFLWFVGHRGVTLAQLSDHFNITLSSVRNVLKRINKFLDKISESFVNCPVDRNEIKNGFASKYGFPNVLGCVDGSHVVINAPKEKPEIYFNRKKDYSLQFQIICDHNMKVLDVFCGYPGSVHDARVYRNSFVYTKLPEICAGGYILGDSAYPLDSFCLIPYKDNGHLTAIQKKFNKRLSKTRVLVENTIGNIKKKFPILNYVNLREIETICDLIISCCVLYNIAYDPSDKEMLIIEEMENEIVGDPNHEINFLTGIQPTAAGLIVRDNLARMFYLDDHENIRS